MEFINLVFTRILGGVTVSDSGLCCCVPCLSSAIIPLWWSFFQSFRTSTMMSDDVYWNASRAQRYPGAEPSAVRTCPWTAECKPTIPAQPRLSLEIFASVNSRFVCLQFVITWHGFIDILFCSQFVILSLQVSTDDAITIQFHLKFRLVTGSSVIQLNVDSSTTRPISTCFWSRFTILLYRIIIHYIFAFLTFSIIQVHLSAHLGLVSVHFSLTQVTIENATINFRTPNSYKKGDNIDIRGIPRIACSVFENKKIWSIETVDPAWGNVSSLPFYSSSSSSSSSFFFFFFFRRGFASLLFFFFFALDAVSQITSRHSVLSCFKKVLISRPFFSAFLDMDSLFKMGLLCDTLLRFRFVIRCCCYRLLSLNYC